MKKKTISAYILATLLTAGFTGTQAAAAILAEGNISVYKGGRLNNTITGKAPADEEALLVCNEACKLKSTGVSIVGAPGTELAVQSGQEQFNLLLKQGRVEFILSGTVGKMGFYTADRQYTIADVIYNASTSSPVRGYMEATSSGGSRIGVHEGRLVFNTAEGAKIVDSNNYIVLAQAGIEPGSVTGGTGGAGTAGTFGAGGAAGTVGTGGGIFSSIFGSMSGLTLFGGLVVTAGAMYGGYEYLQKDDDKDDKKPAGSNYQQSNDNKPASSNYQQNRPASQSY